MGIVTSVAGGAAIITATSGSANGTASVSVQQAAVSLTLSPGSVVLVGPGDTGTITASVLDAGGSEIGSPDLTWSSDDEAIATVSSTGLVTAVASGSATISVEATSGGQSVTQTLSVAVEDAVLVDPAGGEVSLAADAVTLVFPVGAVSEAVFLTAEPATGLPAEPTPIPGTAFDFGPDGIVFDQPVTLTIGYDPADVPPGVTEEELGLHKLVVDGYVRVDASTVDVASKTVSGVIGGFSVFAILQQLEVTTTTLPDGVENVDYGTATLAARGGTGTYAWALAAGSGPLPTGLDLASNGDITGTPTTAGTSNFTVEVTSSGQTAQRALSITVLGTLGVTTTTLPDGVENVGYGTQSLMATGGDGNYAWALANGSGPLPDGLSLAANGDITGTPSVVGTSAFTVEVTSGDGQAAQRALEIKVNSTLAVATTSLPDGVENVDYGTQTLMATGGDGNYTWAVTIGLLPTGLSLDASTGVISGTPTVTRTSDFAVEVTSGTQTAQRLLSIRVNSTVAVTTTSLPDGVEAVAYSRTLTATGGDGSYSWTVSAGSLPVGLDPLATNGDITGTPTEGGSSNFTVEVTSGGQTATQALSIDVDGTLMVTTTSLPDGLEAVAYGQTLAAVGGDGSYSWTVSAGSLPVGLDPLATNGDITGTPTSPGTSNFTVEVTSGGQTAQQALSITVLATLAVTTTSLPDGTPGSAYSETLAASGGDGSYTWSVTVGSLPTELSLNTSTGEISGTPMGSGSTFTVEVTSGDGQTDTRQLTMDVTSVLAVFTTSLPDGIANIAYSQTLTATGGDGSYLWALAGGSGPLPTGLNLATSGDITGAPTTGGASNFTVEVTSGGQTAQQALSIEVVPVLMSSQLCSDFFDAAIATFADASLETAVRSALGIGAQAALTCQLVGSLTNLTASTAAITSLVGAQNLTGLTTLFLTNNSITDISALSGLTNLTRLDADFNSITVISALSGLTSLTYLDIDNNLISDVSALSGLTSLTRLDIDNNSITNISALSGLTSMIELDVDFNSISDISALSGLTSLVELDVRNNSITDISAVSGLTSLTALRLDNNPSLTDIQPLLDNPGLGAGDTVDLRGTGVTCPDVALLEAKGVDVLHACVDVLEDGVPVTGLAGSAGDERRYVFTVPPGAPQLVVMMSGGTGDADLYVRQGTPPTTTAYDCRPFTGSNDETCTFASPGSGDWFILVRGFDPYSGVTLSASSSGLPIVLNDGVPVTGLSGGQDEDTHFVFTVPAGAPQLEVVISGGTGDADLYVRQGAAPTTSLFDCRPFIDGSEETCVFASPGSGDWFIMLRGFIPYSGLTLTATSGLAGQTGLFLDSGSIKGVGALQR